METRDRNEGWKDILKGAEAVPSDFVWEGVEANLDRMEVAKLRATVVFYRRLAAACITIALFSSAATWWWSSQSERLLPELSAERTSASDPRMLSSVGDQRTLSHTTESERPTFGPTFDPSRYTSVTNDGGGAGRFAADANSTIVDTSDRQHTVRFVPASQQWITDGNAFRGSDVKRNYQQEPSTDKDKVEEKQATLPAADAESWEEEKKGRKKEKQKERFWTAVGFSAGTFNNTTPTSPNKPTTTLQSVDAGKTVASETNTPGYTYAVNVGVGTRISKRVMLVGGMGYISQQTDYTATTVISDQQTLKPASMNAFEKSAEKKDKSEAILASTPYKVNNNVQMMSFPVQAGYVFIDRKFSFQVNSGISTDLFLQSTITPHAQNLEKTTQGRGGDSPYRPINFSGMVGTELSYRFSDAYRVSLSPGVRYPLNSIYKSDLDVESNPLMFDVAVRFRYIFR